MNKKGFLGFIVLLVFGFLFLQQISFANKISELEKTTTYSLELEKANYLRTELEINIDHFIEDWLNKFKPELNSGKINFNTAKNQFATEFETLLKTFESRMHNVKFYFCNCKGIQYSQILKTPGKPEEISQNKIAETISLGFKGKELEFSFLEKNKVLFAKIDFEKFDEIFVLPANYSFTTGGN